ncbi:MAG TPA: MG2 domain-containing protein [Candidatus Angelobacter sp.]|nr:MG2 domain-containing protein [Candidatus Angelobacter sp.]
MDDARWHSSPARFIIPLLATFLIFFLCILLQPFPASAGVHATTAIYSRGSLHVDIPYEASRAGAGELTIELLDPEDKVLGRTERHIELSKGKARWRDEIKLQKPLPMEDLVWNRVHYRFQYDGDKNASFEGTESVSRILHRPVVHILGQQSYVSGGPAAVRVIVTDAKDEFIAGLGTLRIELLEQGKTPRLLFTGRLDRRGTSQPQFRFPAGMVGNYQLRYLVDTQIGATEFTQPVRLEDKVSILLTTEKPIYQPGQTIHVRALALDRSDHEAAAGHQLVFEVEDARGNKVFKKSTETDAFGVASAEFALADEVNLGTYNLRAFMGDPDAPTNTAEIALNVDRYVLPKFKVAVQFSDQRGKQKRGYRPGDHVTGTVRANYFFGKPVDGAEIRMKASAMDLTVFEAASAQGKTDSDGAYRFDLTLPKYFAGRPLSHGAARVLIEASVKDSAGHVETRGEPITVSESPLLITAVPEGGTLVPHLENQVFILTSYPDGSAAKTDVVVRGPGNSFQRLTTDDGGVAIARLNAGSSNASIKIDARDREGNQASSTVELQARQGDDQILLRPERAIYRAGDRIDLKIFSTKSRGAAYVDVVKDGQTVLTRDLELKNGQADLSLIAGPELAGTVDFSVYLFGRNAQPIGDHRMIFVQPADELRIEAAPELAVYKPGEDARVRFHVTNARGEGVRAALGLQVVDEAVFALAEKQPGFAKVFFYLEQEVMKPRYEIHSIGMPEIVEPPEKSEVDQRDRAARALFSAMEITTPNKFTTEVGKDLPMAKFAEYSRRYQERFADKTRAVAAKLTTVFEHAPEDTDPVRMFAALALSGGRDFLDPWGNRLVLESTNWGAGKGYYLLRSAGPDRELKTADDLMSWLYFQQKWTAETPDTRSKLRVEIEHDRGAFNGLAETVVTAVDPSGAVIPGATVELRNVSTGSKRTGRTNDAGQISFSGLPAGKYEVRVSEPGFRMGRSKITLRARDRAVVTGTLAVGEVTETIEITAAAPMVEMETATVAAARDAGIAGGVVNAPRGKSANGVMDRVASNSAVLLKNESGAPTAHVRSYFPEALYINPEIITDGDGRASIEIPLADSITTWRMAMIASTRHGALGSTNASLKVFQDFFVDLDLPVTLTQGDRISIPVAIYNYSDSPGEVQLQLKADDWFSLVDDQPAKSVKVDAGQVGSSEFKIDARRIGKFKLTLSAQMNGSAKRADIVVREIEVVPNGREKDIVFNGRLESAVQHNIQFPANAIPEASKIFVRLYPGPISQVVEGMDSILRMPGGCFEQTSSSTYPNVLALDYMKRTKKLTPEVHAKAEGYIANGYQRLLTFEVPGGGFSWFGNAPANKILTAYGLMEFYDMSKVYDVDTRVIARTQQWLASQQWPDGSWKPDTQFINEGATTRYNSDVLRITSYIAWSLENTGYQGPAIEKAKEFVEEHLGEKLDAYTLAVVANFAADYGKDRGFTHQAIQLLLDARTEKGEQAWWTVAETGIYGSGLSASVETTGLAVQALLKAGEASGIARKALSYIASKKDANGTWGTTQATIMALRALLTSTEKGTADVHGTVVVAVNGKPAANLTLTPENNDLFHQFVFKSSDSKRAADVEIRFEGKGGLAYQVVGSYFVPWEEKAAQEPLSIDVAYDRTRLAQDDIATATATVRNNLRGTAKMVMVDLGIPPGFDLLTEDLEAYKEKSAGFKSGTLSKFSLTATQAILYFDSFAPGETVKLKFRLRAKYPIHARTFESRVYEYYDPEISAVARPVEFEVRQR